jgi:hypothetical protein
MRKIKIKENTIRLIVKQLLQEASGDEEAPSVPPGPKPTVKKVIPDKDAAEKSLMSFKTVELETNINNFYDPAGVLDFYFRGVTNGNVGQVIVGFRNALIEYVNAHTPGDKIKKSTGNNIINVLEDIASAVGGSLSRVKLKQDVIKRICQEIYSATEGGITGIGTYKENLASALGSKKFPSFKYSLEALELEKNYARIAYGETFFGRSTKKMTARAAGATVGTLALHPGAGAAVGDHLAGEDGADDAGLYDTLMDEFGDGSEKGNIRNYVLTVLSGKHYFQFKKGDAEVVDISLENIFEKFIKFAKEKVEGKSSSKNDDGSITLDIESESEEDSEEPKKKDSSEKNKKERKSQKETYSKIKGEILRAVVPRSIEELPEFEELFDLKSFQRSIVAGMREDRRGFGNGQDFQIEISFKNEEARIERNFSPVGTHRVKIGGKMLRKAIKSRKWRSNLKEVFADALDDALIAKGTAFKDLKGLRRFRLRIIVPSGFYELNESSNTRRKVFLKGEDILKIIKTL